MESIQSKIIDSYLNSNLYKEYYEDYLDICSIKHLDTKDLHSKQLYNLFWLLNDLGCHLYDIKYNKLCYNYLSLSEKIEVNEKYSWCRGNGEDKLPVVKMIPYLHKCMEYFNPHQLEDFYNKYSP